MNRIAKTVIQLTTLLLALNVVSAQAHSLGIDQAELVEESRGNYVLRVKVPQSIAHLITTPELPERCTINGDPRGLRGTGEIRFAFTCEEPLTARDSLVLPWLREGVLLTARWADGTSASKMVSRSGDAIPINLEVFQAGSGSWLAAARRYLDLGIEHILFGFDHLLFVMALLIMVRGRWMLVKTISAFTVAHSITLALATLGVIEVPSRPVEAVIALSIVFVCVEKLKARQGDVGVTYKHPWIVSFAFGLLHGLGFAGALAEIGLPPSEIPLALLFFNIGVEIGQLAFVVSALVSIAIWKWASRPIPTPSWSWLPDLPVYAIGTMATYWFIERAVAVFPNS